MYGAQGDAFSKGRRQEGRVAEKLVKRICLPRAPGAREHRVELARHPRLEVGVDLVDLRDEADAPPRAAPARPRALDTRARAAYSAATEESHALDPDRARRA